MTPKEPTSNSLRVLIVEDSAADAKLMLRQIARAGFDVKESGRVEDAEGLRGALDTTWDVVLADFNLPSFSGLDALRMINERRLDLPLILVSGVIDTPTALEAMKSGAKDFVFKDDIQRLPSVVRREVDEAAQRRQRQRAESERDHALAELRNANEQLTALTRRLQDEVDERTRAEVSLSEANAWLEERASDLEKRANEMVALNRLGEILQSGLNESEACDAIAHTSHALFKSSTGAVYTTNARGVFVQRAVWGQRAPAVSKFEVSQCWAARMGRPRMVEGHSEDPAQMDCSHLGAGESADGYVCVPMDARGEIIGVLHIRCGGESSDAVHAEHDCAAQVSAELAVNLAEHSALAIGNLRLRVQLHEQSIRDELSGLFNRRFMLESLERELAGAQRTNSTFGLVMIDIDHFKNFNDTYGHEVGDLVIRKLGRLLDRETRDEDIACRFGGEEFLLIMPRISLPEAIARAEAIKDQVKKLTVRRSGGTIGISAGVAVYPQDGAGSSEILRAADAALYQAKRNGRGIVRAASAPDGGLGAQGPEPTVRRDRGLAGSAPPLLHPIRLTQPPHPPNL